MSDRNDPSKTRRNVLKATAAVGAAAAATSVSAGASGGWSSVSHGQIGAANARAIVAETDVYSPAIQAGSGDMPSGESLLQTLAADGLLASGSYADLPTSRLAGGTEGVYYVSNGEVTNLGFRLETNGGVLDVVFRGGTSPIAVFTRDGERVLYGTRDGQTISSELMDAETAGFQTQVSSDGCTDTCTCYNILCDDTPVSYTVVCENKTSDGCVTTTTCAC